ncbi:MAG TPA: ABC transporter permease [Crocinitomicaceae bacterium]|nr:ABC transporter permease [Crocinitomicaceae bacterium]
MKNSLLIALREFKERIGTRSFITLSVLGPLSVLAMIFLLFTFGGNSKQHWNVLVADHGNLLESKIMPGKSGAVSYSFYNGVINDADFAEGKKYQKFDALLEVNEKVLTNKIGFVFFREEPDLRMQSRVQYHLERRLEEVLIERFKTVSLEDYRKIKQPLTLRFANVYDPNEESSNLEGWAGLFFGALIFAFIFLFGMTILRSVANEKSNRIVEVLLASVSPKQLMLGKIIGIGFSAFLQFAFWLIIIGFGLYFMRENIFPDMLDAGNMNVTQLVIDSAEQSYQESHFAAREYNQFIELVFERLQFSNILGFFIIFFILGYLFYGALFAAVGATTGSESDGQQFVLPLIFLLCLALYAGYYTLNYPESPMASLFAYLPFTSPVVVMVKLTMGYGAGEVYQIYVSMIILLISAIVMLLIASRLYKNGILQFGHRVRLKHIFKWLRKT